MTDFARYPTAGKMRDVIAKIVRSTIDRERPRYRYGRVQAVDYILHKASVVMNGDEDPVRVSVGSIWPQVGETVRVEGIGTDRYIADTISPINYSRDLVTPVLTSTDPLIVGHRGGGRIYPEHSMDGYRECYRSGFAIEADIRRLATGELVCIHDATTTRTMSGATATVSTMTREDWAARSVKPHIPGAKNAQPVFWKDVLNEFGGQGLIVAEVKDSAATQAIIDSIVAQGLSRSVILQSFDLAVATQCAAAGIASMFLEGSTPVVLLQDILDAGIQFYGPSKAMPSSTIAAYRAAGLKVIPYTVVLPADWTAIKSYVDGAFFDDPWWATGRYTRSSCDPFCEGQAWKGWDFYSNDGTGSYQDIPINFLGISNGLWMNGLAVKAGSYNAGKSMRCGWAEPVTIPTSPNGMGLRFRAKLGFDDGGGGTTGAGTRWMGVFIGNTPGGQAYHDEATVGQQGYHFLFRRDGNMEIYKVVSNTAAVMLAELDTASFTTTNQYRETEVEIIFNGSGIRVRRLDTGESFAFNSDTAPVVRTNLELSLTCNGTNGSWRDVAFSAVPMTNIGY